MTQKKLQPPGLKFFCEVSCWDEIKRCHAVWETIGEKFPAGKKRNGVKPDRKPFANSFLSVRNAMVSS